MAESPLPPADQAAAAVPGGVVEAAVAAGKGAPGGAKSGLDTPPGPKRPMRPEDLPTYTRSLLRIRIPLVVTLAHKRQPLTRIVELGPGSIIQFDKSCEEMLEMSAGGLPIAEGEAVKVGDKFGLRVTSIVLPGERFQAARPEKR
jgi:flagellar motor switch protein FliN